MHLRCSIIHAKQREALSCLLAGFLAMHRAVTVNPHAEVITAAACKLSSDNDGGDASSLEAAILQLIHSFIH